MTLKGALIYSGFLLQTITRKIVLRKACVNPIDKATDRALFNLFSTEEKRLFKKIESRRKELENNEAEINRMDFGASGKSGKIKISFLTRRASKPALWCRILFALAEELKVSMALELGTCVGISAAYIGESIDKREGQLLTVEGDPESSMIAKETLLICGLGKSVSVLNAVFSEALSDIVSKRQNHFDFVFIDGHHDGAATIEYFKKLESNILSNAVIVFDDIHWSTGMEKAWDEIRKMNCWKYYKDAGQLGICLLK